MKLFKRSSALISATAFLLITGCVKSGSQSFSAQQISGMEASSERANLEGKWNYTMSNPEQEPFSGVFVVQRGGITGYTGWISVSTIDYEAKTNVIKADIQGDKFTYAGEVQTRIGTYPFELSGIIKGDKLIGQNKVKTDDGPVIFNVTATRK